MFLSRSVEQPWRRSETFRRRRHYFWESQPQPAEECQVLRGTKTFMRPIPRSGFCIPGANRGTDRSLTRKSAFRENSLPVETSDTSFRHGERPRRSSFSDTRFLPRGVEKCQLVVALMVNELARLYSNTISFIKLCCSRSQRRSSLRNRSSSYRAKQ